MKNAPARLLPIALAAAALLACSGCATVNEVLFRTADELQRQQQAMAYESYLQQNWYYGRPASDTSAPGIK